MRVATALVAYAHASTPTPRVTQRPRDGGGVVYTLTLDGVTATITTDGDGGVYARTHAKRRNLRDGRGRPSYVKRSF
jgi:hypothetical protein